MADWELVPNSLMPASLTQSLPNGGVSSPSVLLDAWCTTVYDLSARRILTVRTGGHGDSADNGVRAFKMPSGTTPGQWLPFLRAPSMAYTPMDAANPGDTNFLSIYPDGTPASVHCYDAVCYMDGFDAVWSAGGIFWSHAGKSSPPSTFEFNLINNQWVDVPDRLGGYGTVSVWDPVDKCVYFRTSQGFYKYTPVKGGIGTYTTLFQQANYGSGPDTQSTLAIDVAGRKLYYLPHHSTTSAYGVRMIDLTNLGAKDQLIPTTGATIIETFRGAKGVVFDNGFLVALGPDTDTPTPTTVQASSKLYLLDLTAAGATKTWVRLASGGFCPIYSAHGTWKKFFKDPLTGYYQYFHQGTGSSSASDLPYNLDSALYRILPDFGTIPATKTVKVAASYTVEYKTTPTTPPDPPGGTNPLPLNTWIAVPNYPGGSPELNATGKHSRIIHDTARNRLVEVGGDNYGSDSGQTAVRVFDSLTGLDTILSPSCLPAPEIMPNWPDNVGFTYDSTRDRYLMFKGFYFWDQPRYTQPAGTMTLSGLTGTVTCTMGAGATYPLPNQYMVGSTTTPGNPPKLLQQKPDAVAGTNAFIAQGTIVSIQSPTQFTIQVDPAKPFTKTSLIALEWRFQDVQGGKADAACGRNMNAGDPNVLNTDCIFNPRTNKWERHTWPVSPYGYGSDGNHTQAAYDEATDTTYLIQTKVGMLMLHHSPTEHWEVVPFGNNMTAGTPERDKVVDNLCERSQIAIVGDSVWTFSPRGSGKQGFVEYIISQKTWHHFSTPAYTPAGVSNEPMCIHDPISHVLIHCRAKDLRAECTEMWIFDLISRSVLPMRPISLTAYGGFPVKNGIPFWDPFTGSLAIHGRSAPSSTGLPGRFCAHYRYGP